MINIIKSYYRSMQKMAIWMVFIALLNFSLGILAFIYWGNVGISISIILGLFGGYQIFNGLRILILDQNGKKQVQKYEQTNEQFCNNEVSKMEAQIQTFAKFKNLLLIAFLIGLLCLFMGAFGSWNDINTGIGAALALQSAIMLIFGLLNNYQREFYLLHLQKNNR